MGLVTRATEKLDIEHPVIQAPMAGGVTTPELVAAVSEAGGLGSIGAAYLSPRAMREAVRRTRELTDRTFAVNLFVPQPFEEASGRVARANELMESYRDELGIDPPGRIDEYAPAFEEQFEVVLEEGVPIFSFTFGALESGLVGRLKEKGTTVVGTATTVEEAKRLQADGTDLIVAQGAEAGGHRGTFLGGFEEAMVGTMALVPQVVDALTVPVIAAGGIMDGRGLAAALALGAEAVQMGTAFLVCEESGAHPAYKEAVLGAAEYRTILTRAFSGRPARGIENRFLREMREQEGELPPYPVQNAWTKDIRGAAQEQDRPEFMSLWAGQAARLGRPMSAAELTRKVAQGAADIRRRGGA
jgi:nitronate monooxygenase